MTCIDEAEETAVSTTILTGSLIGAIFWLIPFAIAGTIAAVIWPVPPPDCGDLVSCLAISLPFRQGTLPGVILGAAFGAILGATDPDFSSLVLKYLQRKPDWFAVVRIGFVVLLASLFLGLAGLFLSNFWFWLETGPQ